MLGWLRSFFKLIFWALEPRNLDAISNQTTPKPMPEDIPLVPKSAQDIPTKAPVQVLSDELLAVLTIYMEARGEPFSGKVGVAEVLLNRVASKHGGATSIGEVVFAPFQFSCWNTDSPTRKAIVRLLDSDPVYQECFHAYLTALAAGPRIVAGAVFYYNPAGVSKTPAWAIQERLIATIGNHKFYK